MALAPSLLILRLTLAAMFAPWVIDKFINPDHATAVWAAFYFIEEAPAFAPYIAGAAQALILVLFVLGLFKLFSYGLVLLMHGVSTLSTWEKLIHPYDGGNILFWAAVPALGAAIALFLLREEDTLLSLG